MAPSVSLESHALVPLWLPCATQFALSLSHPDKPFAVLNGLTNPPLLLAYLPASLQEILYLQRRPLAGSVSEHSLYKRRSTDAGNQRMVARSRASGEQAATTAEIPTDCREKR